LYSQNFTTMKRLFDIPLYQLKNYPNKGMFVSKINGAWIPISTQEFVDLTYKVSKALIDLSIQPGDKIGIISTNRLEWNVIDIASLQIGAIVVPLYPTISENDYKYIFKDAGIKLCFVGSIELYNKISNIKNELTELKNIYCFDQNSNINYWKDLFNSTPIAQDSDVESLKNNIQSSELATIIYTSGTTGNPKGVMLSHSNIISNVEGCIERMPADQHSKVLTFLPVCHVYERMLHYLYMFMGCSIHFAESMDTIGENIKEVQPDMFTAVPRLIEKVYDKIIRKGEELAGLKKALFFWAVRLAEKYDTTGTSIFYQIQLKIARKLIFSKWQEALGGNVKAIASGSAALQPRLARIFLAAGINVLEGYGLTETSPVVSVNCLKNGIKIGTVGTTIEKVDVKIATDGEILVKGPNVMMGYYNNEKATKEVIDEEGYFHTGDIGEIVEQKFLKITDRKKEIFKTSGGKYIVPQVMENKFKESRFIEQIIVIGENEKYPAALIVPNFLYIREWLQLHSTSEKELTNEQLILKKEIIDRIEKEISHYNEQFGHWEQLKKFKLLSEEFSVENGELTPTLKLKRKIILEKNKYLILEIYND
jgi:long-chain acyl-CoA synthetase